MATTLATAYTLATDATFQQKVTMACVLVARNVKGEAPAQSGTERRSLRRQELADQVLRDPDSWTQTFAYALATVPEITAASTDAALVAAITAGWTTAAGVIPGE